MEKIILRKINFEGKKDDFSQTYDFRILGIEKRLLDFIGEYCEEDIEQKFIIIHNNEEKLTFSKKDFDNDNVELTLKQASSKCLKLEIVENIMKTLKNENKDSENIVINRVIKLHY